MTTLQALLRQGAVRGQEAVNKLPKYFGWGKSVTAGEFGDKARGAKGDGVLDVDQRSHNHSAVQDQRSHNHSAVQDPHRRKSSHGIFIPQNQ